MNALASVIRGTGNMFVPALAICVGVVLLVPLSPCLIFGLGPFPALGIAGGGVAVVFTTALTACGAGLVHPVGPQRWCGSAWCGRGGRCSATSCGSARSASVTTLQTTLTVALTTALVGAAAGPDAIAGYGTGGAARVSAGAAGIRPRRAAGRAGRHQHRRRPARARAAHRADRRRAGIRFDRGDRHRGRRSGRRPGSVCSDTIHTCWRPATAYLRAVGPAYGFFGLGLSLYFASQGAGRLFWPLLAGALRLLIAVGGGWLVLRATGSLGWLFAALSTALLIYGGTMLAAVSSGAWFRRVL